MIHPSVAVANCFPTLNCFCNCDSFLLLFARCVLRVSAEAVFQPFQVFQFTEIVSVLSILSCFSSLRSRDEILCWWGRAVTAQTQQFQIVHLILVFPLGMKLCTIHLCNNPCDRKMPKHFSNIFPFNPIFWD